MGCLLFISAEPGLSSSRTRGCSWAQGPRAEPTRPFCSSECLLPIFIYLDTKINHQQFGSFFFLPFCQKMLCKKQSVLFTADRECLILKLPFLSLFHPDCRSEETDSVHGSSICPQLTATAPGWLRGLRRGQAFLTLTNPGMLKRVATGTARFLRHFQPRARAHAGK